MDRTSKTACDNSPKPRMVENGLFDKRKRKAKTKTKKKIKKQQIHKVDNGLSDKEKRKEQKNKLLQFPR